LHKTELFLRTNIPSTGHVIPSPTILILNLMKSDKPNPQSRTLLNLYFNVSFRHTPSLTSCLFPSSFPPDILGSVPNFHDVITVSVRAHQSTPDQTRRDQSDRFDHW